MHGKRWTAALSILAVAFIVAGAAQAGAAKIPAVPKVHQKLAKLDVDVAGFVETRALVDTTSKCYPGRTFIQTNRFQFETGDYVRTYIKSISGDGIPTVITSPFSRSVGSATVEGAISDYGVTNYCAPHAEDPEPLPPICAKKSHGKISVALTAVPLEDTPEGDLTPLGKGAPLMLSIRRNGTGKDTLDCYGKGAQSVTGPDTGTAVIGTSPMPIAVSEVLPTRLGTIKLFNLQRHKRLRSVIVLDGPCDKVRASVIPAPGDGSPRPGALNADGDCWLTGKVVLSIRTIQ